MLRGSPNTHRGCGMLLVFLTTVRTFSPSFQECISQYTDHNRAQPSEEHDAVVKITVGAYVSCTGKFVSDQHDGIIALGTLLIAAFTAVLWIATSRQARLTKEAFTAEKRAFVFVPTFNQFWELDAASGLYHWRFRPVLRNSGETPTRRMRMYVECEIRNTALPPKYGFTSQPAFTAGGTIPPKFELQGGVAPRGAAITPQNIVDAQQQRVFIYLWGWIRYRDVFPRTREHITRYRWAITPTGDPFTFIPNTEGRPPTPGTISFGSIHVDQGNCIDDECE